MLSLILLSLIPTAFSKQLFVTNNCDVTVWPAITSTNAGAGYTGPTGWEAPPGNFKCVTIPDQWNGRIWARRGCRFDENGQGSCLAGDCAGRGLECGEQIMGWANLAEVNFNPDNSRVDWYDVSAVPGFVVPMSIVPGDGNCETVTCAKDLNDECPDERLKIKDGDKTIGCLSACMAGVNAGDNSANCCSGSFLSHEACRPEMIDFYDYFKQGCEKAYAYPRDDNPDLPPVVFTCNSNVPWYRVTFCP